MRGVLEGQEALRSGQGRSHEEMCERRSWEAANALAPEGLALLKIGRRSQTGKAGRRQTARTLCHLTPRHCGRTARRDCRTAGIGKGSLKRHSPEVLRICTRSAALLGARWHALAWGLSRHRSAHASKGGTPALMLSHLLVGHLRTAVCFFEAPPCAIRSNFPR